MKDEQEQRRIARDFLEKNVPCFRGNGAECAEWPLQVDWNYGKANGTANIDGANAQAEASALAGAIVTEEAKKRAATHISESATEEEKKAALGVGGARFNEGKVRFDLMPPDALWELAKVYTFGARKYKDRNWEKGMVWGICFAAAMRHLWKWWRGERNDPESGLHHLAHAAWNCMAALSYELRGMTQHDDRFRIEEHAGSLGFPHD